MSGAMLSAGFRLREEGMLLGFRASLYGFGVFRARGLGVLKIDAPT